MNIAIYKTDTGLIDRRINCPDSQVISQCLDGEAAYQDCPEDATHIIDGEPRVVRMELPFDFKVQQYTHIVQNFLDSGAREHNYDSIISACTYATSTVPKFQKEGQACVEWRDAVWTKCYDLLELVQSGSIPEPTTEELINLLPVMVWPT